MSDDEALATKARALAHPVRVRILRILSELDGCVCGGIVEELGLPQSTVSQHLKVLKESGLIRGSISGRCVCYCLDRAGLKRLRLLVAGL